MYSPCRQVAKQAPCLLDGPCFFFPRETEQVLLAKWDPLPAIDLLHCLLSLKATGKQLFLELGPTHLRVLGDPVAEHIQHTVGGSSADHKLLVAISLVRGKPWQC